MRRFFAEGLRGQEFPQRLDADIREEQRRIGEILRKARDHAGLSLEDVAGALKISASFIKALEEGRHEALPAPSYAQSFLRHYASHLGLDAVQLMGAPRGAPQKDWRDSPAPMRYPEAAKKEASHTPSPRQILTASLLFLLGAVLYQNTFHPQQTEGVPPPPQRHLSMPPLSLF